MSLASSHLPNGFAKHISCQWMSLLQGVASRHAPRPPSPCLRFLPSSSRCTDLSHMDLPFPWLFIPSLSTPHYQLPLPLLSNPSFPTACLEPPTRLFIDLTMHIHGRLKSAQRLSEPRLPSEAAIGEGGVPDQTMHQRRSLCTFTATMTEAGRHTLLRCGEWITPPLTSVHREAYTSPAPPHQREV